MPASPRRFASVANSSPNTASLPPSVATTSTSPGRAAASADMTGRWSSWAMTVKAGPAIRTSGTSARIAGSTTGSVLSASQSAETSMASRRSIIASMKPCGAMATLRELLAGPEPVLAPGAYDALSARLVERAGFPAVYMTGFGASASQLGRPDVGLLSFAEMADHARRLVQAVDVPLIADADDGYGNPLNVMRTVREYAAAGVAALHIEDQVAPKRCGHMDGKDVIDASEMVEKVRAAVEARGDGR